MNQYNMLQSQDIEQAVDLGARMVSCRDLSRFKTDILKDLTHFLGGETSAFLTFLKRDKIAVGFNCAYGISERMHQDYVEGFFRNDPAVNVVFGGQPFAQGGNASDVILLEQHMDYYNFTSGFFYNAFLRPLHIHHLMLLKIMMRPQEDSAILIGVHRPRTSDSFSPGHLQKARMIIPALAGAMYTLISRDLLEERQAIIDHLAHAMKKTGLLILNENMDILYVSASFQSHLGHGFPAAVPIPENIISVCHQIRTEIGLARHDISRIYRECHSADDNIHFNITVCKTESPVDNLRFIIYSNEARALSLSEGLMQHYHLTHREKDIACQVTLGLTNIQIAEKLGICMRTVENHLRAIYIKTNVKNRTSLTYTLSQNQF